MIPTTEPAKRLATLFNRRASTHWSEKEVKRYRQLVKDGYLTDFNNIELIERYYFVQRKKGDRGIHRRDLYTFLNNFSGELDRARAWETDRRRKMRPTNGQRPQREATDEEFELAGQIAKREVEALRKKLIPT